MHVPNTKFLQIARERLDAMRHTSLAQCDRGYRDWLEEASAWLDAGVYGRCSVCGCALEENQIANHPEQKCCSHCRKEARRADRHWLCLSGHSANGHSANGHSLSSDDGETCPGLWSTRERSDRVNDAFLRAAELWSYPGNARPWD